MDSTNFEDRTLFERFRAGTTGRSAYGSIQTLEASILSTVSDLCNTICGESAALYDYGTLHLSDVFYSSENDWNLFLRQIERTIEKYEPRLGSVSARRVERDDSGQRDSPLYFAVEVHARLAAPKRGGLDFRVLVSTTDQTVVEA